MVPSYSQAAGLLRSAAGMARETGVVVGVPTSPSRPACPVFKPKQSFGMGLLQAKAALSHSFLF